MSSTTARLFFTVLSLCVFFKLFVGPVSAQSYEPALTPPNFTNSILTLTAELHSDELSTWLSEAMPKNFVGKGSEKVCQRVLGIKICGTATWQYQVIRTGNIRIVDGIQNQPGLTLETPLIVDGIVGVEGDVARALGLSSVPIAAELKLLVNSNVSANRRGCPLVTTNATARWVDKPTVVLPGNIKIRLTEALENALAEQMEQVQEGLNQLLDCDLILAQLEPAWSKCHIDATREETGPALWELLPKKVHWWVKLGQTGRTMQPNQTLALVVGINADVNLQLGLRANDVESRLQNSDCAYHLTRFRQRLGNDIAVENGSQPNKARLVFDRNMTSRSTQTLRVNATHESLAAFAESNYAGRNLGKDNEGNEVVLKTITLLPGDAYVNSNAGTNLTLEAQFDALVRASDGFVGWIQSNLGFADKNLSGVMRIDATPVWNKVSRRLHFDQLNATVTQVESGSKLSLTSAVFAVIQRHVQKTLAEQSSVQLGNAIDRLSKNINDTIDVRAQETLDEFGGVWRRNTASVQVDNIVAAGQGLTLKAQLNANWVIRFHSATWPRDLR